jgi:hypothetical protein
VLRLRPFGLRLIGLQRRSNPELAETVEKRKGRTPAVNPSSVASSAERKAK